MDSMSANATETLDPEDAALAAAEAEASDEGYTLRLADRCDVGGCGAQAFYAVFMRAAHAAPLLFCGHHSTKHEPALAAAGPHRIVDQRHTINEKPSQSSPG